MRSGRRGWLRGVAILSSGSLLGNAAAFLASIALARLYTPAEHGQLAVVSAYGVVLTPLISGRLEAALTIPREDPEAFRVLKLGMLWATLLAVPLTVLALGLGGLGLLDGAGPGRFLWAAPVFAFLSAVLALMNQYSVRMGRYRVVGTRNVVYPSAMAGSQVGLGLAGAGAWGLVVGTIAGRALTVTVFVREFAAAQAARRRDGAEATYRRLLRRFARFPTIFAAAAMLNALGLQLPVLLLGAWYGDDAAGLFGMSQRTLGVPIVLLGAAIGQVYLSEMSRAMREGSASALRIFDRSSVFLLGCGVLIATVLLVAGPSLFGFVFGSVWTTSGEIARAMGVSFALQLVAGPLSQALAVYEKHWRQLGWDVARLLLVATALYTAHRLGLDLVAACWVLGAATASAYVAAWFLARSAIVQRHGPAR